jgi:hypothetical protein
MKTLFLAINILFCLLTSCNNHKSDASKRYGELTDTDYKKDTLKVDDVEVPVKTAITQNESQKRIDFQITDNLWLKQNLEKARELKDEYWEKPMPPDKEFMPHVLDEVFNSWTNDKSKTKKEPDFVINSLGAAFGQYLVDHYNMKWIMISDEYGTDYAGLHKKWDIIAYPLSSVKKSIDQNKVDFFKNIELIIKEQIKEAEKGQIETTK